MTYRVMMDGKAMHFEDGSEAMEKADVYSMDVTPAQDLGLREAMDRLEVIAGAGSRSYGFEADGVAFVVEALR